MRSIPMRHRGAMALVATLLAVPMQAGVVNAGEPAPPADCASFATGQVATGATGNGWTVERGTERERFRFEVLGVIEDAIAPSRDMIVVELSDVPGNDMIARAGGVWAGMSGSPLYLGNKLLGAISYKLANGASMVAGATRALDMADLLAYDGANTSAQKAKVTVPNSMRAVIADSAGISTASATTLERLPVPVAASGLSARGRTQLEAALSDRGISAIVTSSARASRAAGGTISARPTPGGNFAGVVSYGDVTIAGVGTTTYVCGNKALAFGHPLAFEGPTQFGANNANALTIVADGLAPYKLANITGLFGKLDQDRLTGVRANLSSTPTLRPITSHVSNADTGSSRNGRSDVTTSDWIASVAPLHLLANIEAVFDQSGAGSSEVSWTITGKRRNGTTWQLEFANRYASQGNIAFESVFQLAEQLEQLDLNPFEAPRFTSVHIDATVDDTFRQYDIATVKVSRNGGGYRERSSITVDPGDELRLRVGLRQFRGDIVTRTIVVNIPNEASGSFGSLLVRGGGEFFFPGEGESPNSFAELIQSLENGPRNDDLLAQLDLISFEGVRSTMTSDLRMDALVSGFVEIGVSVN
jgi:hypothetical protein